MYLNNNLIITIKQKLMIFAYLFWLYHFKTVMYRVQNYLFLSIAKCICI